jgi:transposase
MWTYLGIVNPKTGEYQRKQVKQKELLVLNYGDSFILHDYSVRSGLNELVTAAFGEYAQAILALCFYKLTETASMQHAGTWFDGNYAKVLFPETNLSTQRISDVLKSVGDERSLRHFFQLYLRKVYSKNGVIIDSTGLPNDISFPLTAFGHHAGNIEKEARLLMVVDKDNSQPLYFRYMPGNIVDVSSLKTTISEIAAMGIKTNYALIDAGYYSEENISHLFENDISFLIRLPAGRALYANLIDQTQQSLEKVGNSVVYGERVLYIQKLPINLYEKYPAFAYICCDIKRRATETAKLLIEARENNFSESETADKLRRKGIFVLISATDIPVNEILPLYYLRQTAEQIFQISKSNADILPLRVHSESTFRGVLLLNFLSVVLFINLREQLSDDITVESALKHMRNLMCKVYDDKSVIVCEPTKIQKTVMKAVSGTVGKF